MPGKVKVDQGLARIHIIIRVLGFASLVYALSFGLHVPGVGEARHPEIGFEALVFQLILSLVFILVPLRFGEWLAIFSDMALGCLLIFLFGAHWVFYVPFLLASFTAATLSWQAALYAGLAGTVLFSAGSFFLLGKGEATFAYASFLPVLALLLSNISFLGLSLLRSYTLHKADSLVDLIELGQKMGSTLTFEKVFDLLFQVARVLFAANTCVVYLRDEDGIMRLGAETCPYPKLFRDFSPNNAETVLNQVVQKKLPETFYNIQTLPPEEQIIPKTQLIRAGVAVPLVFEDHVLGLIFLGCSSAGAYDSETLKLCAVLANQAAIAIQNVQLHKKTTVMAVTDSVSGLYTHGRMQEVLEKEFYRCKYDNLPLSFIILDVDHFKIVNDTYGHPEGDALLRQMAGLLRSVVPPKLFLCRYGGDEFVVLLPEVQRMGAAILAERIKQAFEEHEFVLGSKVVHITVSVGVASFPEATTKKELIEKSDQALYRAKNEGRNKVCVSM